MKRILFFAVFTLIGFTNSNAQEIDFGAKAGLSTLSLSEGGDGVSGFFFGVTGEFGLTEEILLQPELLYSSLDGGSIVSIPVVAKYYVSNGFNLQAGPQINYDLGEAPEDFSALAVALAIGAGYDINEQFFVDARYALELNNRYTGEGDDSWKYNMFFIGVGYNF